MTAREAIYRATVYADEAATTALTPASSAPHSEPFQVATATGVTGFKPYMGLPEGRQGEIDPLERGTDTGQIRIRLLDVRLDRTTSNLQRWVTAFLGDDDAEPQLGGKKIVVEESLDGGSTWSDFYTGRIQAPALDGRQVYSLTIRDLKDDLKVPTFVGAIHNSVSYAHNAPLLPIGLPFDWADKEALPHIPATFDASGVIGSLEIDRSGLPDKLLGKLIMTEALRAAASVEAPPKVGFTQVAHAPIRVRAKITSGANSGSEGVYQVAAGFGTSIFSRTREAAIGTEGLDNGQNRVTSVGIVEIDGSNPEHIPLPGDGDSVEFWLESDNPPVLVEDVHPVTLAKDLLRGYFNRLDTDGSVLESWDFSDPDNLESDSSFGTFRGVIEEKADDLWDWIRKHLFQVYGFGAYLSTSGDVTFVDLRTPTEAESTGLATIQGSDLDLSFEPEWEHARGDAVNRIEFTVYLDRLTDVDELEGDFPRVGPASIESVDVPFAVLDIGDPNLPQEEHEIDAIGLRYTDTEGKEAFREIRDRVLQIAEDYRIPFGRGPEYLRIRAKRDAASVSGITPGAYRNVAVDELPDPETNVRGGSRLMQVVAVNPSKNWIELRLLDISGAAQATAPSLPSDPSCSQKTDLSFSVTQAVTPSSDGAAVVEYNVTAQSVGVRPSDDDTGWRFLGRKESGGSDPSVDGIAGEKRVWTRARTVSKSKAPSAWVYPPTNGYCDTSTLPGVTNLTQQTNTGTRSEWTWSVGDASLGVRVTVENTTTGARHVRTILQAGATAYEVRGTSPGDSYSIDVQQVDDLGGVGAAASDTWTAGAGEQAPQPLGLTFIEPSGDFVVDEVGVGMYLFPADPSIPLILQIADDDGAGSPDTGTTREVKLPMGATHYLWKADQADGDFDFGELKHFRLVHRGEGYTDSDPSSWRGHVVTYLPKNVGPRPKDPDLSVDLVIDPSDGTVDLEIDGDDSMVEAHYWASKSSFAGVYDSGSTAVALDGEGNATVTDILTLTRGERAYVTVAVYRKTGVDPDGNPLPVPAASAKRSEIFSEKGAEGIVAHEILDENVSGGNLEGELTLDFFTGDDTYQVDFWSDTGPNPVLDGASTTLAGRSAGGTNLATHTVTTTEKRQAFIRYVITNESTGEVVQEGTVTFDADLIPEISIDAVSIDPNTGDVTFAYTGDADTDEIRYTAAQGAAPSDPTTGSSSNLGRRDNSVGTAVTLGLNEVVYIKARGYNSSTGDVGPITTISKQREANPKEDQSKRITINFAQAVKKIGGTQTHEYPNRILQPSTTGITVVVLIPFTLANGVEFTSWAVRYRQDTYQAGVEDIHFRLGHVDQSGNWTTISIIDPTSSTGTGFNGLASSLTHFFDSDNTYFVEVTMIADGSNDHVQCARIVLDYEAERSVVNTV